MLHGSAWFLRYEELGCTEFPHRVICMRPCTPLFLIRLQCGLAFLRYEDSIRQSRITQPFCECYIHAYYILLLHSLVISPYLIILSLNTVADLVSTLWEFADPIFSEADLVSYIPFWSLKILGKYCKHHELLQVLCKESPLCQVPEKRQKWSLFFRSCPFSYLSISGII